MDGWLFPLRPWALACGLTHMYIYTRWRAHVPNCYAHFCIYLRTHFRHAIIHVHTHVHVYTRWDAHVTPYSRTGHPWNEDISLNQLPTYGPSYIEMCIKWSLNEDTSFSWDIWSGSTVCSTCMLMVIMHTICICFSCVTPQVAYWYIWHHLAVLHCVYSLCSQLSLPASSVSHVTIM